MGKSKKKQLKLPKGIPNSYFLQTLAKKAEERKDTSLDFLHQLNAFRQRVSYEASQINVLFPEFTPHDEHFHLKPLFYVADELLGEELIDSMNSTELFVLACALYGHDWGMAVPEDEKDFILKKKLPTGKTEKDMIVLPGEKKYLQEIVKTERLTVDNEGRIDKIDIEIWREYVRRTHAFRSAIRSEKYFGPIDSGVADAVSRVIEGHWLNIEDIMNPDIFPLDSSVLGETVNLRALAIYLRLIDMLDLADNRTPYVVWKYVAPRDPKSKMEWEKHRALRAITCPEYQKGRIIKVDGRTEDHEVYAALEDLRIWVESQFRQCRDSLAQMNHPRHKLDIYDIHWKVTARGFWPLSIRFEFNRERMFEILSDEIYQGDPYVFLRELLQNSIDAIAFRREMLKRRGQEMSELGVIKVKVNHFENGDCEVIWTDNGIGMDEYIIRNYLAVAGKSYYRSLDFEKEGLSMDAISRFGIGFLSCFMVADRIEIETWKDPYLYPKSMPLKVVIPSVQSLFRIEEGDPNVSKIGSTIRVSVQGKRLLLKENESIQKLEVTTYLSEIAGFVEFPIVIEEEESKTVIVHPYENESKLSSPLLDNFELRKKTFEFPVEEVLLPQDIVRAKEYLSEETIDLFSDLGIDEFEGKIIYLILKEPNLDFVGFGELREIIKFGEGKMVIPVRSKLEWELAGGIEEKLPGITKSSKHYPSVQLYAKGILIPKSRGTTLFAETHSVAPRVVANFTKSFAQKMSISRMNLHGEKWYEIINRELTKFIFETKCKSIVPMKPEERMYKIWHEITQYHLDKEELFKFFPESKIPIAFIDTDGELKVEEWEEIKNGEILVFPRELEDELISMIYNKWVKRDEYGGFLRNWRGGKSALAFNRSRHGYRDLGNSYAEALDFTYHRIKANINVAGARFLSPPWKGEIPLVQYVYRGKNSEEDDLNTLSILEKVVNDNFNMTDRNIRTVLDMADIPEIEVVPFLSFESCYGYAIKLLNAKHNKVQKLIRSIAELTLKSQRGDVIKSVVGEAEDILNELFAADSIDEYNRQLELFYLLLTKNKIITSVTLDNLLPFSTEFVPGTESFRLINRDYLLSLSVEVGETEPFGMPIG